MVQVRRRKDEPTSSALFRFGRKMKRSGVILETRKRRFRARPINRRARRKSAIYRGERRKQIQEAKKLGAF